MRKRKKVWEKPGLELGMAKTASRVIGHWLLVLADAGSRPVRSDTEAFSVLFQFLIDYHERGEQLAADINGDGNTTNTQTWSSTLAGVSDCEREGEELLISDMNGFLPTNLPLTISQSAGSETICLEINTIIIEINKPLSLHPGPDDQSLKPDREKELLERTISRFL